MASGGGLVLPAPKRSAVRGLGFQTETLKSVFIERKKTEAKAEDTVRNHQFWKPAFPKSWGSWYQNDVG